ncbi:hypothetical protein [Caulobacter sp. B11]|uniref:hypothetical protein n=1 Tax=Caulobacter sp. B11 TaxID=2048899 RepID=UPI00117CE310|nr:hypothetical protein [Caulobacter sp. B11]
MTTNLTGIWQGLYSYPEAFEPVGFTATLLESGKWLTGSIHEIAVDESEVFVEVYATLQGGRNDRQVHFTKTYDGSSNWSHAVHYEGALNDDFTELEGRWSIPGVWSGKFLMIRPEGRRASVLREAFEAV